MDPPQSPSQPPPSQSPSPSPPQSKLRLMCSYGGQIIPRPRPRPHTKSLFYLGGETRLISLNPSLINTLSSFISHLSINLSIKYPFTLKYQLPYSTLDSLISLSSDDDLQFMFCEHVRVFSANSRIRLFLFNNNNNINNVIDHPKTEAWFFDALKSSKILVGFDNLMGEGDVNEEVKAGNGVVSMAESLVLETSSSFGSSSSTSLPNSMDNNAVKEDPIATLASETCHGVIAQPSSVENAVVSFPVISESNFQDPRFQAHNVIDFSSYQLSSPSNHGMFPVSSYYQVPPQQQQFLHYQQNQLYHPVYFPPVGQTQLVYFPPVGKTQPPIMHLDSTSVLLNPASHSLVLPQVSYKDVKCESLSQNVEASSVLNPTALKPRDEIQQQPQFGDSSRGEVSCNHNDLNDDPARIQIYKSQPPPPVIPSQFQNKTKASTTLLSDAMAQLQMIQIKQ